jgi:tetratricopeptide (TPR) repeat protein
MDGARVADQEKDPRISRRAERRARSQAGGGERPAPAPPEPQKAPERPARASARDRNQRMRERERARSERRARRDEPDEEVARGLDAGEMVDDALARASHAAVQWLRHNATLVQWLIVLVVVGFGTWRFVVWRVTRNLENSSDQLMVAVEAERGSVGEQPPMVQPDEIDVRPHFNTNQDRLMRAEELYRKAAGGKASAATTILAKLGLAGVVFDLGKFDEALATYREVKGSALAAHDPEVRARATEGVGLSLEAKGDKDGALAAFHELENSDIKEYQALGLYQQARMRFAKGEREQAKQLLAKLAEKTKKPEGTEKSAPPRPDFVARATEELELAMDPKSAMDKVGLAAAAHGGMEEDQLAQLHKMLADLQKGRGPGKLPGGPPAPLAPARPASSSP